MHKNELRKFNLTLIILAVIVLTPVYILLFFSGNQQREYNSQQVLKNGEALIKIAAVEEEATITELKQDLVIFSKLPSVKELEVQRCNDQFAELLKIDVAYANIGVLNQNGKLVCSGLQFIPGSIDGSDRQYFKDAQRLGDFSVGEYQIGKVTKKASINFGYPLYFQDGTFKGVIFIALDLSWINRYLEQLPLPQSSIIAITDHNGVVVSSAAKSVYKEGDKLSLDFLGTILAANSEGRLEGVDQSGNSYYFYYSPLASLSNSPLHLLIGLNKRTITSEFDAILANDMIVLILAPILSILLVLFLGQRFKDTLIKK